MHLTVDQTKGRIKKIAREKNADARVLIREYMMERFLERLSVSRFKGKFIVKGGILVTSMLGVALRSTMDIDTSLKGQDLSPANMRNIITEITKIDLEDGVEFEIKELSKIMDEMQYPGVRITMNAILDKIETPIKIDISTDDVITPGAIEYRYKLMLDEGHISLMSYNLETVLAEKLQTILARGEFNTRMRDFYDIKALLDTFGNHIKNKDFQNAFRATCQKRGTEALGERGLQIIETVSLNNDLRELWKTYQNKYHYAADIQFEDVILSAKELWLRLA